MNKRRIRILENESCSSELTEKRTLDRQRNDLVDENELQIKHKAENKNSNASRLRVTDSIITLDCYDVIKIEKISNLR